MGVFARIFSRLLDDRRAATAIEYALLGSLVAVGCIAALLAFADSRDGLWTRAAELLVAAMGGGS
jgi:Flp pilus assembly pilin Flp